MLRRTFLISTFHFSIVAKVAGTAERSRERVGLAMKGSVMFALSLFGSHSSLEELNADFLLLRVQG